MRGKGGGLPTPNFLGCACDTSIRLFCSPTNPKLGWGARRSHGASNLALEALSGHSFGVAADASRLGADIISSGIHPKLAVQVLTNEISLHWTHLQLSLKASDVRMCTSKECCIDAFMENTSLLWHAMLEVLFFGCGGLK